jgi:isopenicillin-N epimerase
LTTDHAYNACKNVLDYVAARSGARVVVASIPFPIASEDDALERIVDAVTPRTRLALIDHVTSPTGLVLPLAKIVRELDARGVDVLVDGAHGPGMLDLELSRLGAAYYAANFHKWTCAPKGAGMLWVRPDKQAGLHPAVISHGFNSTRPRARFLEELDWTGTDDPTPWLCVPVALRFLEGLVEGGWPAIRARNRALVLRGRELLCDALDLAPPAPESMIGALAAVPIPDGDGAPPISALYADALQTRLFDAYAIEVPIPPWPAPPQRLLRISAYLYNEEREYEVLASALLDELGR